MPKSALTGTEKKAKKRDIKFTQKLQDEYLREHEAKRGVRRHGAKAIADIAKGKGGPTTSIKDLMKDFKKSEGMAKKYFEPIKKQTLSEYHQNVVPGINTEFGSESKSSSALNQALAASGENLQRSLASDFAGLQMNLGQNLLQQSEQGKVQRLNAMLSAGGAALGQQISPQMSGFQNANQYLPKSGSPNQGQRITSSLLGGLQGGVSGFLSGGIPGAAAGAIGGGVKGYLNS